VILLIGVDNDSFWKQFYNRWDSRSICNVTTAEKKSRFLLMEIG